jgi:hypothetical protein
MGESVKTTQKIMLWLVIGWLAVSIIFSLLRLFDQPGAPPTFFGLFLIGPLFSFVLAYAFSKNVRAALFALPLWAITAIHVFRFVGIPFVLGAITRDLPPQFGWPAGVGDITAAVFSIPLAVLLYRKRYSEGLRLGFIAWNIFGLIDLFSAVTLGLLYSVSVVGILSEPGLNTRSLSFLPVSLIPTFYVPILMLLHFLALRRSNEITMTSSRDQASLHRRS